MDPAGKRKSSERNPACSIEVGKLPMWMRRVVLVQSASRRQFARPRTLATLSVSVVGLAELDGKWAPYSDLEGPTLRGGHR